MENNYILYHYRRYNAPLIMTRIEMLDEDNAFLKWDDMMDVAKKESHDTTCDAYLLFKMQDDKQELINHYVWNVTLENVLKRFNEQIVLHLNVSRKTKG